MTTTTTTAISLSPGDIILDADGLELRIVAIDRNSGASGRILTLTVEYVEAAMMPSRPEATTMRVGRNAMVRVPEVEEEGREMTKPKRVKLTQRIPDAPSATFQAFERTPGANYWHVQISDACSDMDGEGNRTINRPEFTCRIPKTGNKPTPQQVANAGAGECNEGRRVVTITRFADGVPDFSAIYIANGRWVLCKWSTDQELAPIVWVEPQEQMRRIAKLQDQRRQAVA